MFPGIVSVWNAVHDRILSVFQTVEVNHEPGNGRTIVCFQKRPDAMRRYAEYGRKKLGFGCMRLPLTNREDPKSIDLPQVMQMVDLFS